MINNLVLGSEGFIGKALCKFLSTQGERCVPYDIKRTTSEDLRSSSLDLEGVDRIYFLAWDVGGAKYLYKEDAQIHQLNWNVQLLVNTMPQIQSAGIPFLFVSSQLAEDYDTVYGVTKRLGEIWTHILGGTRVRLWNVYGVMEEQSIRSHAISDFIHQAISNNKINMMTTGEEMRQFIYIDDACHAMKKAFDMNLDGVYDVTSFEWTTILEVAREIGELTGCEVIPGKAIGSTPITPMRGKIPGWSPEVSLTDGLQRMVEEYQK